jgi:hypothetical protein
LYPVTGIAIVLPQFIQGAIETPFTCSGRPQSGDVQATA